LERSRSSWRASLGAQVLGSAGALVEFQAEAVHQFAGLVQGQAAGGQVRRQKGAHVLVDAAHGVAVHGGVKDHVEQPDALQRLVEGLRGARRRLAQVGGHGTQFVGPRRIATGRRLGVAMVGQAGGIVHDGPQGNLDGIEVGRLLRRLGRRTLSLGLGQDALQPQAQQPGIVGHDVAEHTADAQALGGRRGGLLRGGVIGKAALIVDVGPLQGHGAGKELPVP
jgi:hypothetical protein